jgi:ABC-2 type transport system permease protein
MSTLTESRKLAFFRFDMAGALRSRWLAIVALIDAALFGLFLWLGLRESAILGFTGISRVVLNVVNVTLLAVPIVVLIATSQSIVRARSTGLLEFLLSQPTRRGDWFSGLLWSRAAALLLPLAFMLLAAFVYGAATERGVLALARELVTGFAIVAGLVIAFLGLGLYISAAAPSEEKAIVWALGAWLAATALHDFALIGLLLRTRLPTEAVFFLAAVNPVEAARVALLANLDAQLAILGPVGFWIANKLGAGLALFIGIVWPTAFGIAFALFAKRKLQARDLVA